MNDEISLSKATFVELFHDLLGEAAFPAPDETGVHTSTEGLMTGDARVPDRKLNSKGRELK